MRVKKRMLWLVSLGVWASIWVLGCKQPPAPSDKTEIEVQGHRGARGYYPENSIPGFLYALQLGVQTLELDVVISKDSQVVVSHEPWMSPMICLLDSGMTGEEAHQAYNMYEMTYQEISAIDCGTKPHPGFPDQQKIGVSKPLLSSVFDSVKSFTTRHRLPFPTFNIEIKSRPVGDHVYHPEPEVFADLLVQQIDLADLRGTCTIQAFDPRPLTYIQTQYPDISLSFLFGESLEIAVFLDSVGLNPEVLSPNHRLVDQAMVEAAHKANQKVIPWTANDTMDIQRLIRLNVDGIISDYPDRVIAQLGQVAH